MQTADGGTTFHYWIDESTSCVPFCKEYDSNSKYDIHVKKFVF